MSKRKFRTKRRENKNEISIYCGGVLVDIDKRSDDWTIFVREEDITSDQACQLIECLRCAIAEIDAHKAKKSEK